MHETVQLTSNNLELTSILVVQINWIWMKRISWITVLCTHFVCCSSTLSHQQVLLLSWSSLLLKQEKLVEKKTKKKMWLTRWKFSPSGLFTLIQPVTGYRKNYKNSVHDLKYSAPRGKKVRSKAVPSRQTYIIYFLRQ